ncbi:hypothetical protein Hanom_Chr00s119941g01811151 [Helianthus anomalus]
MNLCLPSNRNDTRAQTHAQNKTKQNKTKQNKKRISKFDLFKHTIKHGQKCITLCHVSIPQLKFVVLMKREKLNNQNQISAPIRLQM